jgi:hypothetical protein
MLAALQRPPCTWHSSKPLHPRTSEVRAVLHLPHILASLATKPPGSRDPPNQTDRPQIEAKSRRGPNIYEYSYAHPCPSDSTPTPRRLPQHPPPATNLCLCNRSSAAALYPEDPDHFPSPIYLASSDLASTIPRLASLLTPPLGRRVGAPRPSPCHAYIARSRASFGLRE